MVDVPNSFIRRLACKKTELLRWVFKYVKPFFPATRISVISVGNEVLPLTPELAEFLVHAMENLCVALRELGLGVINREDRLSDCKSAQSKSNHKEPTTGPELDRWYLTHVRDCIEDDESLQCRYEKPHNRTPSV